MPYVWMTLFLLLPIIILSCMITLMFIFMGHSNAFSLALLAFQQWLIIPLIIIILAQALWLFKTTAKNVLLKQVRHMPGWLIFGFFLTNSIVLIGELAIVIIHYMSDEYALPFEHIPLVVSLLASLVFICTYMLNLNRHVPTATTSAT